MRISNTGFLTSKYNNNNKKTDHQLLSPQTDTFLCAKSKTPTFKGNFSYFDLIKEFFESGDIKKLKSLPTDEPINIETARKLVKLELKNNDSLNIEKKVCEKLDKLEKSLEQLTPEIVKIYTTICIVKEGIEFTLEKYDLDPTKEIQHFFNKDGKINTLLWEKFQHYAKEAIAEKDYYSQKPLFLMEVLPCCKDKNGIHPEVLDLLQTKLIDYVRENHLKKNNVTNLELIKLLQYLDKTDKNDYSATAYAGAIECAWNKKDKPDLNAIAAIKELRNKLSWGLSEKDCGQIFYYIENAKDKNGNYDREYDKYFKKIISNGEQCLSTIPIIVNTSRIHNKESLNNLSKSKLEIISNAITSTFADYQFSTKESLHNFIRLINGNQTRTNEYLKLKNLICNINGHLKTNTKLTNEIFELTINKQDKIPIEAKNIISYCLKHLKNGKEESLIDLLEIIKLPNDKYDTQKYNKIVQNCKKTGNDLYPIIELAKFYYNLENNNKSLDFNFDELTDLYQDFYEKGFVEFTSRQNDSFEENVYEAYDLKRFLKTFIENLKYLKDKQILNKTSIKKSTELSKDVGLENVQRICEELGSFDSQKVKNFRELLKLAKENKQTLRDGIEDLSDDDINVIFCAFAKPLSNAYTVLGKDIITYAFNLKKDEFLDFCYGLECLKDYKKSGTNDSLYDAVLKKIVPENTQFYIDTMNKIKSLKQQLSELVPLQQKEFENKNKAKIKELKKEISELKKQLIINSNDIILKQKIANKTNTIKTLSYEIQEFYKQEKFLKILNEINKQKNIIAKIESEKITDFEEIINHIKNLSVLTENFEQQDWNFYVDNMNNNIESRKRLTNFIQEKVFQKLGLEYSEIAKSHMDFSKSKYLSQLLQESDTDIFTDLNLIYNQIENSKGVPKEKIFDSLTANIETKKIFKKLGIDYDKWVSVDKNSYVKVTVETDRENAKSSIIKNLEDDFNSPFWDIVPKDEFQKILDEIKKYGFELKNKNKILYDDDGYISGEMHKKVFLKNGQPITFEDIHPLITAIKKVMNKENYWNTDIPAEEEDNRITDEQMAKQTLLTHIVKMRNKELETIKNLKSNEVSNIEVHKTDMNDIVHSLFLGNHACCCTAIGSGCNSWSATQYIMNKCISSIEVMDGKNFVGNTMCYIANVDGELALILDNIELSPKYQYNDKIRDAIFQYAEKMCAEIGKPDMRIYAGSLRHKVNMNKYPLKKHKFVLQGSTNDNSVYVDFLSGPAIFIQNDKTGFKKLYQIK